MNASDLIHPLEPVDDSHPLSMAEMRQLTIKNLQAVSELQTRVRRLESDNAILRTEIHRLSDYLIRRAAREKGVPVDVEGILDCFEINTAED